MEWPFGLSRDALFVLRHHEGQLMALAQGIMQGLLNGFIHLLMYEHRWEEVGKLLLLPASEFKRRKIIYAHFIRLAGTNRLRSKTCTYSGHTSNETRKSFARVQSHYSKEHRKDNPSKHYRAWEQDHASDEGFVAIAYYDDKAHPSIFELPEGFAIATLSLFESDLFFRLISPPLTSCCRP